MNTDTEAAQRLLGKIRNFVRNELDEDERALFASLVAPGVAQAHDEPEVAGYSSAEWVPESLPRSLSDALKESGVRVVGLGENGSADS